MGGNTSKQQALRNGISNHRVQIYPKTVSVQQLKRVPDQAENNATCQEEIKLDTWIASSEPDTVISVNEQRTDTQMYLVTSRTSTYDFNVSMKPQEFEVLPKEEFYPRPASSKIPIPRPCLALTDIPMEKLLKEKSKMDFHASGDFNNNYVVNRVNEEQSAPIKRSYSIKEDTSISSATPSTTTSSESDSKKKKLIIRGLKHFCQSRGGSSYPPTWVKDFPCKSKYHPDNYVYDFEEGPNAVKRNTSLMNKCNKQGGRCGTCGIYAVDVCRSCRKCELDCACPKIPKIPEFVSQLLGTGATWSEPEKTPRDFAGEEQSRQYGVTSGNYNPYYSQMSVLPQCYSPYPYYSPIPYSLPTMYPGCYPGPPTYMPMPMMPPQPPVPNYYGSATHFQTSPTSPESNNFGAQLANPQPQTSFNMSFYE